MGQADTPRAAGLFRRAFVTRKKTPEFYASILRRAGVGPEEALMVGDRCENDIIPAKKAGMLACHARFSGQKPCAKADFEIRDVRELGKILGKRCLDG